MLEEPVKRPYGNLSPQLAKWFQSLYIVYKMAKKHRQMHKSFKNAKIWVILNLVFDCPPLLGVVWNTFVTSFSPLVTRSRHRGKLLVQATESCDSHWPTSSVSTRQLSVKQVSVIPGPRNKHPETKRNRQKPAVLPIAATGQQSSEWPGEDA